MEKLSIDGDQFEGGGSILRVAVPLAVAMNKEVTVYNIRKKRAKPGLRLQHLIGLQLINEIVDGNLEGAVVDSGTITLTPGEYRQKKHRIRIPTAGSITLIMQIVQNYVSASGNAVECTFIGGGTHTNFSPTWDEIEHVTAYHFKKLGIEFDMNLERVGYYPKGGGKGYFRIWKKEIREPPEFQEEMNESKVNLISLASSSLKKAKVAERQIEGFKKIWNDDELKTTVRYVDSEPGTALIGIFHGNYRKGYSSLGARGKPAEKVGKELAKLMRRDCPRNALDLYVSDQILVPLAFAPAGTTVKIVDTAHVKANLNVINQILPDTLKPVDRKDGILTVKKL